MDRAAKAFILALGKIIKQVTESRQALWEVPEGQTQHPAPAVQEPQVQKRPRVEPPPKVEHKPKSKGSGGATLVTADTMKNGTKLCREWNRGHCQEPCPHGFTHACNALLKNGRVCGMRNHRSINCRNVKPPNR